MYFSKELASHKIQVMFELVMCSFKKRLSWSNEPSFEILDKVNVTSNVFEYFMIGFHRFTVVDLRIPPSISPCEDLSLLVKFHEFLWIANGWICFKGCWLLLFYTSHVYFVHTICSLAVSTSSASVELVSAISLCCTLVRYVANANLACTLLWKHTYF